MIRMMLQLYILKNLMTIQMEKCVPGSSKKRSKLKMCLKMMMRITLPVWPSGIAYPPMESLGRGNRVIVPRQMLIPTMKGKYHDE